MSNFVFYDDGRERVMRDKNGYNMDDTSGYEMSGVRLAWLGLEDLVSEFLPSRSGVVPAVLGMVNWLSHEVHPSPSFYWWFPPPPSHLSLSLPSPKNTKLSHPSLSLHAMIMSLHRVLRTEFCIHRVLIISRSNVSRSQPVSHLLADLTVLNSLHSHH